MKVRSVGLAIVAAALSVLVVTAPASAHRLDEVLQATTVRLAKGHLTVDVRLTPGVQVYRAVAADIDTDGDGTVSDAEGRAYAERVRHDLSLSVDGRPTPLRPAGVEYPTVEAMSGGAGQIRLTFEADVPGSGPDHRVEFDNHFHCGGGAVVCLVNCLVPADPELRVTGQARSRDQSQYQLDYAQQQQQGPAAVPSWMDRNGGRSLVTAYLFHGVRHILTGYDHLLFVGALVLAATTLWDLVKVVTSFTVAHTITLTLAALGWVHLSGRIVEPLISASIVFVAVQNVFWPRTARGWSRLGATFFFGLFHGLGFAGGLLDAMRQLPAGALLLAIAAFSVGVEAGHQMVVLPLFATLKVARATQADAVRRAWLSMAVQRAGSAGISLAGCYYLCLALTGNA